MKRFSYYMKVAAAVSLGIVGTACSAADEHGIADKRSDFSKFLPMSQNVGRDGLKTVKPFFRSAQRGQITAAIEKACTGGKAGSSVYEPRDGRGYYVNCNPKNRQLLNGYVPANSKERPHSR